MLKYKKHPFMNYFSFKFQLTTNKHIKQFSKLELFLNFLYLNKDDYIELQKIKLINDKVFITNHKIKVHLSDKLSKIIQLPHYQPAIFPQDEITYYIDDKTYKYSELDDLLFDMYYIKKESVYKKVKNGYEFNSFDYFLTFIDKS